MVVNINIGKLLEDMVCEFMYNTFMYIMNHYPTPEDGKIEAKRIADAQYLIVCDVPEENNPKLSNAQEHGFHTFHTQKI